MTPTPSSPLLVAGATVRTRPRLEFELSRYGTPRLLSGAAFRLTKALVPAGALVGEATRAVLLARKDLFGLGSQDDLVVVDTRSLPSGTVVRLRQTHDGVRVHDGGIVASVDTQGDVVHLHNGTLPDIHVTGPALSKTAEIRAALRGTRPNATQIEVELLLRAADGLICGTAEHAWRVRYRDVDGLRVAWVVDGTRALLEDLDARPQVAANVGFSHKDCQTGLEVQDIACSQAACSPGMGTERYQVCLMMSAVWNYLGDTQLHGSTARLSYDGQGHCMEAHFVCDGSAGGFAPMDMSAPYETQGVVAHEFGHGVIASRVPDAPPKHSRPVYDHVADIFAMAVDSLWRVERTDAVIRDWANPASVTSYPHKNKLTRFPVTFDDYNGHSVTGNQSAYYISWHVPSTLLSHMIYQLAQQLGRSTATEIVYRTVVQQLSLDSQFYFSSYAGALRQQADAMGYGAAMRTAQENAKLWWPSEQFLTNSYTRPGIASGFDYYYLGGVGWIPLPYFKVFYRRYVPGGSDDLRVASRDFLGNWTTGTTALSSGAVGGAISMAYDPASLQWFVAWKGSDGAIRYARRLALWAMGWPSTPQLAGVSTNADVKLVTGNSEVRLYFRDVSTSRLRFIKWTGSTWSTPFIPPAGFDVVMGSGPSAAWDGTRFHISYIDATGGHGVLQAQPSPSGDSWQVHNTFNSCIFDNTASKHAWTRAPAIQATADKALLVGPIPGQDSDLEQLVLKHSPGSQTWSLSGHGGIERLGTDTDLALDGDRLWLVSWKADSPYYGSASVSWRQK